jgi:hypothetical protein
MHELLLSKLTDVDHGSGAFGQENGPSALPGPSSGRKLKRLAYRADGEEGKSLSATRESYRPRPMALPSRIYTAAQTGPASIEIAAGI